LRNGFMEQGLRWMVDATTRICADSSTS
jgi:hypothetical protein